MTIHEIGSDLVRPRGPNEPQRAAASLEPAGGRQDVIASRLAQGYYHDPAVAKHVAGRLLASGDLDVRA